METLDKYQVLEKIGVGGFGVVYKAYDPFIKRAVAIKTCTSEDAEMRERFMREAEIAGNLHHRNIVTTASATSSRSISPVKTSTGRSNAASS